MLEDENYRSFAFPGHMKCIRNVRENRGIIFGHKDLKRQCLKTSDVSFSSLNRHFNNTLLRNTMENIGGWPCQRDLRGNALETSMASPSGLISHLDENGQGSFNDIESHTSHCHSKIASTWDKPHFEDQLDNESDMVLGQRCKRNDLLGSFDWSRPLKRSHSGNHTSNSYSFIHSSRSKCNGAYIVDGETNIHPGSVTPIQSPVGDSALCTPFVSQLEDTFSRKKQRLRWGDGLAMYEKKKIDGPDEGENKNAKPAHSVASYFAEKTPIQTGSSECASPTTPYSVDCSYSSGMDDRQLVRDSSVGTDISNLNGSPGFALPISLEISDFNLIDNLSTSITKLLHSDWIGIADFNILSFTSTTEKTLAALKMNVLKSVEITESEIDQLQNELMSLKYKPEGTCPYADASSSMQAQIKEISCEDQVADSNLIPRPSLQDLSKIVIGGEMLNCGGSVNEINADNRDSDTDSPGTLTSKFVEPLDFLNAAAPCDSMNNVECSGFHDDSGLKSFEVNESIGESPGVSLLERKTAVSAFIDVSADDMTRNILINNKVIADRSSELFNELLPKDQRWSHISEALHNILINNKVIADKSCELFNELLPKDQFQSHNSEASKISYSKESLLRKKFVMRKHTLRFKERVVIFKFRAFGELGKEDMRFLSHRKSCAKAGTKIELSSQIPQFDYQKHRPSMCSQFSSSGTHVRQYRNHLKMPSLILGKEKMASRFMNTNGLVEDPLSVEKEKAMINPWSLEEKGIFMDKLSAFGKDFKRIVSFLDHKTIADCIEFYYKNHKLDGFNKTKKAREGGKLGDYKTLLDDNQMCADVVEIDQEAAAADVLVEICGSGSSEAMSSCMTSSEISQKCRKVKRENIPENMQNDETHSDESIRGTDSTDWGDEDKSLFLQAVSSYGNDFSMISRYVGKSRDQCKIFFSKARKCLRLDLIHSGTAAEGMPMSDDPHEDENLCILKTNLGTEASFVPPKILIFGKTYSDEFG